MNSKQTLKLTAPTLLLLLLPGAQDASAQSVRRLSLRYRLTVTLR